MSKIFISIKNAACVTNKRWLYLLIRFFFHFFGGGDRPFYSFFLDMFSYLSQDFENTVTKNTTRSYKWNDITTIFIMCKYISENVSYRQWDSMSMITTHVQLKDHIKPAHLHSRINAMQLLQYALICHFMHLGLLLCPLHQCFQKRVNINVHCFFCKACKILFKAELQNMKIWYIISR